MEQNNKKSKGFKIGIVVLVAAILGVGIFAAPKIVQAFRKMTMSPAEYYQYVETKNRDDSEAMVFGYYDTMRKSIAGDSYAKSVDIKAELSDTAKSLLETAGLDVTNVQNMEINMITGKEGTALSNQIKLRGNDQDLITVKSYTDSEEKEYYYQIPELSEGYLDMSAMYEGLETELSDTAKNRDGSTTVTVSRLGDVVDYEKLFMETDTLKELYRRYTDILIKSAKNVKRSEGGCKVEKVSQEADKYTVTLDGEEISKLIEEVLQELKNDKSIQKFLEELDENTYQEFTKKLDELLKKLDSGKEQNELKAVEEVQISSDEEIIAREIVIEADGEKVLGISYALPRDGEKFACHFAVTAEDDTKLFYIDGSGTFELGMLNGEMTLGMDDPVIEGEEAVTAISLEKLLKLEFKDYDMSKFSEGEVKGTIVYSTEALAELANYSIEVESQGNMQEATGKITVFSGKEEYVSIDVTAKSDASLDGIKPSEDSVIYDRNNEEDMLQYESEMDMEQLMTDIQEKLGVDFSALLDSFLMSAGEPADIENLEEGSGITNIDEFE